MVLIYKDWSEIRKLFAIIFNIFFFSFSKCFSKTKKSLLKKVFKKLLISLIKKCKYIPDYIYIFFIIMITK